MHPEELESPENKQGLNKQKLKHFRDKGAKDGQKKKISKNNTVFDVTHNPVGKTALWKIILENE